MFEFEDLHWWPTVIRDGMTDYLGFILNTFNLYEPVAAVLLKAIDESKPAKVIDLCSGGGGPVNTIQKLVKEKYHRDVYFTLTDKYPNIPAFKDISEKSGGFITGVNEPVDATNVPAGLGGLRTIFSGFHHFDKSTAQLVIKDAAKKNQPLAIFDGGDKNLLIILAIVIGHPILFVVFTPFIRPFRWSRILFTYIIPLIPVCTVWDGVVSIIRLYQPKELLSLARAVAPEYKWTANKVANKFGMKITYLVGIPAAIH